MTIIKGKLQQNVLDSLKQNKSLNQISKEFNLSKTTVFYWYKKAGKFKIIKVKIKQNTSPELIGEFLGIFAGDGCYTLDKYYHHQIRIFLNSKDKKYINHVKSVMSKLFSKSPHIYTNKEGNVTIVRIISKDVYSFIKNYLKWKDRKTHSVCLKKDIRNYPREFLIGFVRGVFDTDGYINRTLPRVVFGTVSEGLSKNVERTLSLFEIDYNKRISIDKRKNRKPLNLIEISRNDVKKFVELIKPFH